MTRRLDLMPDRREAAATEAAMLLHGWNQVAIDTLGDTAADDEAFGLMVAAGRKILAVLDAVPPQPRKAGPLNTADAFALGSDLGGGGVIILAFEHVRGPVRVAAWDPKAGGGGGTIDPDIGNAVGATIAAALTPFPTPEASQ